MSEQTAILIATIGTRDLAYREPSGRWLNVGNDRARDWEGITQEAEVAQDLASYQNVQGNPGISFRSRTQFLLKNMPIFKERLQPIILGQLLQDFSSQLKHVYLIGTDQPNTSDNQRYREKDTRYCAEVIAAWIKDKYAITSEVIYLGHNAEDPSDFDAMIRWCKQEVWLKVEAEIPSIDTLFISPKGGVGQSSDALRVTALSRYADKHLLFCDFREDEIANLRGEPSPYKPFSQGIYQLWDLKQREAIALLDRYDYSGVERVLKSYLQDISDPVLSQIKNLLSLSILWNIGDFAGFAIARGEVAQERSQQWWWTAYEAAYLGVVRLNQSNTVEALFHSFRAVEGLISKWAEWKYPKYVEANDGSPQVKFSILEVLPNYMGDIRQKSLKEDFEARGKLGLYSFPLYDLLRQGRPEWRQDPHIKIIWDKASPKRNKLFHRLLGLQAIAVFEVWETTTQTEWEARILGSLNFVTAETFTSLAAASLMSQVHQELKAAIATYQP